MGLARGLAHGTPPSALTSRRTWAAQPSLAAAELLRGGFTAGPGFGHRSPTPAYRFVEVIQLRA